MLGKVSWWVIILGVAVSLLLVYLLNTFVFLVIDSHLYDTYIAEGIGVTAREDALYNWLSNLSHLSALILAFFLSSILVGRTISAFPELNGAVSAATAAVLGLVWLVGPVVRWIWEPINDPGEAYTRSDNLNTVIFSLRCSVRSSLSLFLRDTSAEGWEEDCEIELPQGRQAKLDSLRTQARRVYQRAGFTVLRAARLLLLSLGTATIHRKLAERMFMLAEKTPTLNVS